MSSLTPFSFESHEIRTLTIGENPWFVAKDVAEALEYVWKGTSGTIGHVPEEWRGVCSVQTPSGIQEMATLSEPGLYFFINRSDKPKALPFQKWVAGDVIPAIRKTGHYTAPGSQPQSSDSAVLARQLADALQGKVIVDYEALCRLARMTRAGLQKIAEGEKLLEEAEQVGLDLERQCGKPLIKFDIRNYLPPRQKS